MSNRGILVAALLAGLAGVVAGLVINGPGPLLGSEPGQRALQTLAAAGAPAPPEGLEVAGRGDAIPRLELPGLDGDAVALPDGRGRPLLRNALARRRAPCRAR